MDKDHFAAAGEALQGHLQQVGFDFHHPDPTLAWFAFEQFCLEPLPSLVCETVGFTCEHRGDRDDVLWLGFERQLRDPSDPTDAGRHCGCLFSIAVPPDLRDVGISFWWWAEHGTLQAWMKDVEAMPAFQRGVTMSGWRWEGFGD